MSTLPGPVSPEAGSQDHECGICLQSFDEVVGRNSTLQRGIQPCCSKPICRGCHQATLQKSKLCPFCTAERPPGNGTEIGNKACMEPCEEENCPDAAVFYCSDCGMSYCKDCDSAVHSRKALRSHIRVLQSERRHLEARLCSTHRSPFEFYCSDCEKALCRDCVLPRHQRHNTLDVTQADDRLWTRFQDSRKHLQPVHAQLEQIRLVARSWISSVERDRKEVVGSLEERFKAAADALEKQFKEVEEDVHRRVNAARKDANLVIADAAMHLSSIEELMKECECLNAQSNMNQNMDAPQLSMFLSCIERLVHSVTESQTFVGQRTQTGFQKPDISKTKSYRFSLSDRDDATNLQSKAEHKDESKAPAPSMAAKSTSSSSPSSARSAPSAPAAPSASPADSAAILQRDQAQLQITIQRVQAGDWDTLKSCNQKEILQNEQLLMGCIQIDPQSFCYFDVSLRSNPDIVAKAINSIYYGRIYFDWIPKSIRYHDKILAALMQSVVGANAVSTAEKYLASRDTFDFSSVFSSNISIDDVKDLVLQPWFPLKAFLVPSQFQGNETLAKLIINQYAGGHSKFNSTVIQNLCQYTVHQWRRQHLNRLPIQFQSTNVQSIASVHPNSHQKIELISLDGTMMVVMTHSMNQDDTCYNVQLIQTLDGKVVSSFNFMVQGKIMLWNEDERTNVELSTDNSLLAVVDFRGIVHIWRTKDGQTLSQLETSINDYLKADETNSIAVRFDAQASLAVVADRKGRVSKWLVSTGRSTKRSRIMMQLPLTLKINATADVFQLAREGIMVVFRLDHSSSSIEIKSSNKNVFGKCSLSYDGTLTATLINDDKKRVKEIHLYCIQDSILIQRWDIKEDIPTCLAFSPDGTILACGCRNGMIILWHTAIGAKIGSLKQHTQPVISVYFKPDSTLISVSNKEVLTSKWC